MVQRVPHGHVEYTCSEMLKWKYTGSHKDSHENNWTTSFLKHAFGLGAQCFQLHSLPVAAPLSSQGLFTPHLVHP